MYYLIFNGAAAQAVVVWFGSKKIIPKISLTRRAQDGTM